MRDGVLVMLYEGRAHTHLAFAVEEGMGAALVKVEHELLLPAEEGARQLVALFDPPRRVRARPLSSFEPGLVYLDDGAYFRLAMLLGRGEGTEGPCCYLQTIHALPAEGLAGVAPKEMLEGARRGEIFDLAGDMEGSEAMLRHGDGWALDLQPLSTFAPGTILFCLWEPPPGSECSRFRLGQVALLVQAAGGSPPGGEPPEALSTCGR